ncbi:SusC/RagA family TonB-linked outer membrane protein [Rhizosphaericola mali]|uniref:TonB-dependent receptor n=1 Tax=Rhizosphaericola mali TaxID=2545455 RepID=A0A5P2G2X7_9BACT|nr:TonB-dependent receptor [Rhizosphaericola mali]QES89845.1 TonB-dependent receptor [Rhizosphaericola mali]
MKRNIVPILMLFSGFGILSLVKSNKVYSQEKQSSLSAFVFKGKVTNEKNEPLRRASVVDSRSGNSVLSGDDGSFSISVHLYDTLSIKYMGMQSQTYMITGQSFKIFKMEEGSNILDEVVAVGYGKVKRSDFAGAVASVSAKDLNTTTPTLGQALVGKVAGVQVSQVSGAPYSSTKIRVRGVGSINASSDPLYVIDGYPAGNDVFINPDDIATIDILKDAASAAIYGSRAAGGVVMITTKRGKKGQSSFSYNYQIGDNQLSHKVKLLNADQFAQLNIDGRNNSYHDLVVNSGLPWDDAMYSDDNDTRVKKVGNAASVSILPGIYDYGNQKMISPKNNTDWQDQLYRNALMQRHNLAFRGGSDNIRYSLSGGYQDQPGIMVATGQKRINFRANIDADVNPKLKIGANAAFTSTINQEAQQGRFDHGPIMAALLSLPIFAAKDSVGNPLKYQAPPLADQYGIQPIENPVAMAEETKIKRTGLRSTYNAFATYEIIKDLQFKANLGMQTYNEKYDFYLPSSLSSGSNAPGSSQALAAANAQSQTLMQKDMLAEFTLHYQKHFGKNNIDALGGYTVQQTSTDQVGVIAKGFADNRIEEITAKGADPSNFTLDYNNTGKATWTLLSYLARVGYNYDNRYFLTGSFRTDGSSRFGANNRYGVFPSVSASWNLSREKFYHDWLGQNSTLRLRGSWGKSGNNNIGNYNSVQVMSSPSGVVFGGNNIATAYAPSKLMDQNLGWETTSQFNFGFDATMFNNRLSITANYYLSKSYNLLFNQTLPALAGTTSILTNLRNSKVQNKGIDIQINGTPVSTNDFELTLNGNFSLNRNKVLDMGGASTIYSSGAERQYITHVTEQGQPIGMFYGYKVKGMVRQSDMANISADNAVYNAATQSFPDGYKLQGPARSTASTNPLHPGDLYFQDTNGDGVVNEKDKTIIGSPYAKFTYGFGLNMTYKQLSFSSSFNGSYGNMVLDGMDYYLYNMEGSGNQYEKVANRYRSESDPGNGSIYRASRAGTQSNSTRLSSFYLQSGSYLRCTNMTFSYSFNDMAKKTNNTIKSLRLYVAGDNLFTITKYLGYNPEVDYNNGANLTPGVDYGMYPLMRSYNVGVNIVF